MAEARNSRSLPTSRCSLTNVVTDAIKYSPDGGPGTIVVRMVHSDGTEGAAEMAEVAVRDAGIGIPAEQQAHIFGRFSRALNARERQIDGTGLGLYLCCELVELRRGHSWLEST
jgi:signal transduction histidine kinase